MSVVWLVGRCRGVTAESVERAGSLWDRWEFMGVFTAEPLARAACTKREDFYAQVQLDERMPDETSAFDPPARFPLAEAEAAT